MQTEDGVTVDRTVIPQAFVQQVLGRQYEANFCLGKVKDIDKEVNLLSFQGNKHCQNNSNLLIHSPRHIWV